MFEAPVPGSKDPSEGSQETRTRRTDPLTETREPEGQTELRRIVGWKPPFNQLDLTDSTRPLGSWDPGAPGESHGDRVQPSKEGSVTSRCCPRLIR